MSRRIAIGDGGYRAVTVFTDADGNTQTDVEGIYDKLSTAKALITRCRNNLGERFIDGWVERAIITWEMVDDGADT